MKIPRKVYLVVYANGDLASEEVFRTQDAARRDISMHFKTTERIVGATLTLDESPNLPSRKRKVTP